jgi:hypothetical protein
MKKFTLIKLLVVIGAALALYGQAPTPQATSPLCKPGGACLQGRITCFDSHNDLRIAHCVSGQCVCP